MLIKLNKTNGNQEFYQTIDNGGNDAYEHLIQTPNGMLAVGYNNAEDNTNTFFTEGNGYITFLDSNGIKINGISINNYLAQAYRIGCYNNNYYISGLTENAEDYGLIKIDSIGNIIWHRTYGGTSSDHCFGMDIGENGLIFLTGHTLSGSENWDTYTMKIDTAGNKIWEQKIGNPRGFEAKFIHDEAWDIKSTNDGGCIVIAGTGDEYGRYKRRCGNEGDNSNTWHIYLIKFDLNGHLEWQKTYGGGKNIDWAGEAIDLTSDGGAIVALDNGKFGFVKIGTPVRLINILIFLTTLELLIILIWSTLSFPLKNNSKNFSVRGIYVFIRHPIYTTLMFHFPIITALNHRSFVLLFFIPIYYSFWSRLVEKEEEYLVGIFQEDYVDYMAKIPRFIPWR